MCFQCDRPLEVGSTAPWDPMGSSVRLCTACAWHDGHGLVSMRIVPPVLRRVLARTDFGILKKVPGRRGPLVDVLVVRALVEHVRGGVPWHGIPALPMPRGELGRTTTRPPGTISDVRTVVQEWTCANAAVLWRRVAWERYERVYDALYAAPAREFITTHDLGPMARTVVKERTAPAGIPMLVFRSRPWQAALHAAWKDEEDVEQDPGRWASQDAAKHYRARTWCEDVGARDVRTLGSAADVVAWLVEVLGPHPERGRRMPEYTRAALRHVLDRCPAGERISATVAGGPPFWTCMDPLTAKIVLDRVSWSYWNHHRQGTRPICYTELSTDDEGA